MNGEPSKTDVNRFQRLLFEALTEMKAVLSTVLVEDKAPKREAKE